MFPIEGYAIEPVDDLGVCGGLDGWCLDWVLGDDPVVGGGG